MFYFVSGSQLTSGRLGTDGSDACYEFASIRDGGAKKSIVSCLGDKRETVVYTSTTNSIQIYVLDRVLASQAIYFMLQYSGTVL